MSFALKNENTTVLIAMSSSKPKELQNSACYSFHNEVPATGFGGYS